MLKWESLDDRAKRFAGFQADPEWICGRAETEKNGQIVASITNTILQPTSFSSLKYERKRHALRIAYLSLCARPSAGSVETVRYYHLRNLAAPRHPAGRLLDHGDW